MKKYSYKQISKILYLVSLVLPSFIGAWGMLGFFCILIGWISVLQLDPIVGLPWLANILYWIVLLLKDRKIELRVFLSSLSIVFGFFAVGITAIPKDEGGGNYDVFVGIGFLFWMASFVLILIDQIKEYKKTSK